MTSINIKEPTPVKIANVTLYCEKMTLLAKSTLYHTPTVLGVSVKTNKCRQFTYLTFTGKVYEKERPLRIAMLLNNMNSTENHKIKYKGVEFPYCMVTGLKVEDSGKDYIDITVTLATAALGSLYSE